MKIIKNIKKFFNIEKTKQDNKYKLDIILDHVIDTIEVKGDLVIIKTKKDFVIQNEGHFVHINKGMHVNLSKEIHLNPIIDMNFEKDFNSLEENLKEAERVQLELELKGHL